MVPKQKSQGLFDYFIYDNLNLISKLQIECHLGFSAAINCNNLMMLHYITGAQAK